MRPLPPALQGQLKLGRLLCGMRNFPVRSTASGSPASFTANALQCFHCSKSPPQRVALRPRLSRARPCVATRHGTHSSIIPRAASTAVDQGDYRAPLCHRPALLQHPVVFQISITCRSSPAPAAGVYEARPAQKVRCSQHRRAAVCLVRHCECLPQQLAAIC